MIDEQNDKIIMSSLTKEEDLENKDENSPSGSQEISKDCKEEDIRNSNENPEVDEKEEYLFPDMLTKTEWMYNEMIHIPNRREALIQMVGNWRLIKFRKTYDTFECM